MKVLRPEGVGPLRLQGALAVAEDKELEVLRLRVRGGEAPLPASVQPFVTDGVGVGRGGAQPLQKRSVDSVAPQIGRKEGRRGFDPPLLILPASHAVPDLPALGGDFASPGDRHRRRRVAGPGEENVVGEGVGLSGIPPQEKPGRGEEQGQDRKKPSENSFHRSKPPAGLSFQKRP